MKYFYLFPGASAINVTNFDTRRLTLFKLDTVSVRSNISLKLPFPFEDVLHRPCCLLFSCWYIKSGRVAFCSVVGTLSQALLPSVQLLVH
jgi:hypothetical protein